MLSLPGLARAGHSLYGAAQSEKSAVNRMRRQGNSRWTLVALATVTLALAGCGRKGGLDRPPSAGLQPDAEVVQQSSAPNAGTIFDPGYRAEPIPEAQVRAERAKRGFILDPLLGN